MLKEPPALGLIYTLYPNLNKPENNDSEQMITQTCCIGPAEPQNSREGAAEGQTADSTNKQDVCTGIANTVKHRQPCSVQL